MQGSREEMPEAAPRRSEALSRAVGPPPGALDPRGPAPGTPDPMLAPEQVPVTGSRGTKPSGVDDLLARLEQGANLPSAGDTLTLLGEKVDAAV